MNDKWMLNRKRLRLRRSNRGYKTPDFQTKLLTKNLKKVFTSIQTYDLGP